MNLHESTCILGSSIQALIVCLHAVSCIHCICISTFHVGVAELPTAGILGILDNGEHFPKLSILRNLLINLRTVNCVASMDKCCYSSNNFPFSFLVLLHLNINFLYFPEFRLQNPQLSKKV